MITAGPDGNLWFTCAGAIGRITTSGAITLFPIPPIGGAPSDITSGPDGNVWFSDLNGVIGRITPSGAITEFSAPGPPNNITTGSDGNLWFSEGATNRIGRITPTGTITEFPLPPSGSPLVIPSPQAITSGPDGNLWFVYFPSTIGRMTTTGLLTLFPIGSTSLDSIVAGPDGALWFLEPFAGTIGRITTTGLATHFTATPGFTAGLTFRGPTLWFTEVGDMIGSMTLSGVVTRFAVPGHPGASRPSGITVGSDGNIWFTEPFGNRIVRAALPPLPPVPAASFWSVGIIGVLITVAAWRLLRRPAYC